MSDPYAECLRIARAHYENFPVASRLVPADLRPHIAAVYAFARGADDIADEPGPTPDERLARLDEWREHLRQPPRDAVFAALAETRARFDLPLALFDDLLSAFRQDVVKTRYETWDEVIDYCRRSANPVGRLVLRLAGRSTPRRRSSIRCRLHGAAADELLAGPRRSTGRAGDSTCRAPNGMRRAPTLPTSMPES